MPLRRAGVRNQIDVPETNESHCSASHYCNRHGDNALTVIWARCFLQEVIWYYVVVPAAQKFLNRRFPDIAERLADLHAETALDGVLIAIVPKRDVVN